MNHVQDSLALALDHGLTAQILPEPMAALGTIDAGNSQNHRRKVRSLRRLQQHVLSLHQNLRSFSQRLNGAGLCHYRAIGLAINTRAARIDKPPEWDNPQP